MKIQVFDQLKFLSSLIVIVFLLVLTIFTGIIYYSIHPGIANQSIEKQKDSWHIPDIQHDLPEGKRGQMVKFGYLLSSESSKWMGPDAKSESLRYTGNHLSCSNCHLDNGTRPGAASWLGVSQRYPQFRGRENKEVSLEDRINGCMERSMNGSELPEESTQMKAIVAYMDWLSEDIPINYIDQYKGFSEISIPDFAADTLIGKEIYLKECQSCHNETGSGIKKANGSGYQYPPLWGNDSYNHGAGMARVLTAAKYIKANMPWGQATFEKPKLSDEEAYHLAAYINSFERPAKDELEKDFPDIKLKPVSTAYGPWIDSFPESQHKYGPFPPIIAYYEQNFQLTKTK